MATGATAPATIPTPLAIPAEKNLRVLLERAQAMYPKFVPGKAVPVDPHVVEVREYAKYAIDYWNKQVEVANALLQMEMGDAEHGTVNGIPVITRHQGPVKGHYVAPGSRDYLQASAK